MSSSVFKESPVSTNESRMSGNSNSNVVVVYGKNGMSVDQEGLEALIEEKKVSSISVVRITSPTSSMKDEKEDEEGNNQNLEDGSDLSNMKISAKKDSPEIVGLTIEEFYPSEEANQVARDIMNYAGVVNPVHVAVDYDFQRFIIQNDHCYTPLTSPSQVKQETAPVPSTYLEVAKPAMVKQYTNSKLKKSVEVIEVDDKSENETEKEDDASDYTESSLSDSDNDRDSDLDFNVKNRQGKRRKGVRRARKSLSRTSKKRHSLTESTSGIEEEKKGASSRFYNRLSFDQRKTIPTTSTIAQKPQTKTLPITKSQPNIQIQKIQTIHPAPKVVVQQQPQLQPQQQQQAQLSQVQPQQVKIMQSGSKIADSEKSARARKMFVPLPNTPRPVKVQKFLLVKKDDNKKSEGGFTNISTFLMRGDNNKSNVKVTELKPERSVPVPLQPQLSRQLQPQQQLQHQLQQQRQHQPQLQSQLHLQIQSQPQQVILHPPPTKGFMPLESAAKGQLPAQISIQTHTSSTELAAEHDKQLDLIDSIVKDEMEKSNVIVKNTMNENIPQLVKMLESTEKAVLGKTKPPTPVEMPRLAPSTSSSSTYTTTGVEDIDITNAPLLENAEDDLTEDLLQHVAELMDNKNLQEVVEKQVLTPEHLSQLSSPGVDSMNRSPLVPTEPSSIILPPLSLIPTIMQDSAPQTNIDPCSAQLQPSAAVKKEPIQIVRGDGRVITLPPMEAPTTRAKRRAQTQVVTPMATLASTHTGKLAAAGKNEGGGSRRNSNEQRSAAAARKRSSVSSQSAPREDYMTENESEEEDDSEDDPDKLWCICRQPHNNRFMICCDECEDWFHGTCVNITKAMGLEMEANGIEWTCPKCMKKQEPNQRRAIQRKITEIFDKKKQQQQQSQPQQQIGEEPKKIQIESRRTTPSVSNIKRVDSKKPTESLTTTKVENKREAQKKIPETGMARKLPDMFKREAQKKPTPEMHHRKSTEIVQQKTILSQNVQPSQESEQQQVVKNSDMPEIKTIEIIRSGQDDRGKSSEGQSGKLIIVPPGPAQSKVREETMTTCIVCKKMSRPNSIYCSDDCIRQHAQNALISKNKALKASCTTVAPDDRRKKAFSTFEEALAKASETASQVKNKVERVYVFERKTGRILTGSNAPTTANLKKWLQDNPTFEVVQPGSPQALTIERIKQQKIKGSNSGAGTSMGPSSSSSCESSPSTQYTVVKKSHSPMKIVEAHKVTPSKLAKYPQQVSLKPGNSPQSPYLLSPTDSRDSREFKDTKDTKDNKRDNSSKETPVKQSIKKQSSVEQPKTPQPTTPTSEVEPVRLHMKRTLKEQLISRMNEVKNSNAPKLSLGEIEQFANETENEMFKLFNRDTGAKYKAKYRSLMFNIKDRKNETLFQKICEKTIEPKQLVRMSPEELASQELAQWRHNENKHQLEMIKKSELDLLSCAKNYVLKTHKGEEVIESKSTDRVSLDISTPVEDVVTVLNNSTVSSTSDELPPTPGNTCTIKELYKVSNSLDTSDIDSVISSDSKVGSTVSLQSSPSFTDCRKVENLPSTLNKEREKSKEKDRVKDKEKDVEKDKERDKEKEREREREREREKDKDKEKHKERDRDRERHHAHKSNQKDKIKSKKRSRSRSRSREKEHRHKSPHKEDRRDSITSSSKDKDKDSKIKEKDREPPSKKEKLLIEAKLKPQIVTKPVSAKPKDPKRSSKTDSIEMAKVEDYNLIDKILESTKTVEEAANLVNEKEKEKEKDNEKDKDKESEKEKEKPSMKQAVSNPKPSSSTSTQKPAVSSCPSSAPKVAETASAGDSDQEPTSTVTIATPPEDQYQRYSSDLSSIIWNGSINMIDVATFHIIMQPVAGVSTDLERDLPSELDIVGRISPDTVWEYIAKIKKSPNKEVVIIRLVPSSFSENIAYSSLYTYLDKRKRLGVVKTTSSNIKDFYILPLTSKKLLPPVLQPVNNVEFFEDDSRPDLLMGIVIRIMGKRPAPAALSQATSKVMRKTVEQSVISSSAATSSEERFTPPDTSKNCPLKKLEQSIISAGRLPPKVNSPINIDAVIAPVGSKRKAQIDTDDADEPYSPGGSSDDDIMSTVPQVANSSSTIIDPIADELKRINRQIEAQQMEIVGILSGDQEIAAKSPYATSAATTATLGPALANISIPSNLQQILASIQSKPEVPTSSTTVPPPPLIGSLLASNSANEDEEYTPQPTPSYKPVISEMVNSVTNPPLALGAIQTIGHPHSTPPISTPPISNIDFCKKQDIDMRIGLLEDPNIKKTRWDNQQPPPPGLEDEFL